MEVTLQITTRDMPHSEALESHIREKAEKLERFYPHIMSCRIVVELPHKHHHQGRQFDVHIHMTVPGGDLAVNRVANEDVYVAVRDAFDAAKATHAYGNSRSKPDAHCVAGIQQRISPGVRATDAIASDTSSSGPKRAAYAASARTRNRQRILRRGIDEFPAGQSVEERT